MQSIRNYDGEIRICGNCGQPCFLGSTEVGPHWQHFDEQHDRILCPVYPLAAYALEIGWDSQSLASLKASYER